MKSDFNNNRPQAIHLEEEKFLFPLIVEIERLIKKTQFQYRNETIKLGKYQRQVLAALIIEFAEDLHNNIGLWDSVEYYNKQLFNTPLPLFVNNENEIKQLFDESRIKCFIHTIFFEFKPELILRPAHKDLDLLAKTLSSFLTEKFKNLPKISSVKDFLLQPNTFGWDIKRKLVWVGTHSYLFRISFYRYIAETNKGKIEIAYIDDFICQENTIWSGLGVIDILAKTLGLPVKKADDVRSWYERYFAFYRVITVTDNSIILENIINNGRYKVSSDAEQNKVFKTGDFVSGGIVPYGDSWYWSGVQQNWGKLDENKIVEIKKDFIRKSSLVVYRYDKNLLAKAKESLAIQKKEFIDYYGSELIIFKDGLSMAAAFQKKEREKYETLPQEKLEAHMKKYGLKNPFPGFDFPDELLNSENGVGVYFNSEEGTDIMLQFDNLLNGLKKEGKDLTEDEYEAVRNFITCDAISPNFVKKLVEQYGTKSINSSFLINSEMNILDYLLHRYKGQYFRNRYPNLTLLDV
jgi:hypothetical protein